MSFSERQKQRFGVLLVITILLVGLHLSVIIAGNSYYKVENNIGIIFINNKNFSESNFNMLALFWIITGTVTLCLTLILFDAIRRNRLTAKTRHIMVLLILTLELAFAVSLSLTAATISDYREYLYKKLDYKPNSDLNLYFRLLVIDSVGSFVLEAVSLALLYVGTLDEIADTTDNFYI